MVERVEHPTIGALDLLANPIKMDAFEGRSVRTPPPLFVQHNRAVLTEYGFSAAKIEPLATSGAIGEEDASSLLRLPGLLFVPRMIS